jgi:hypothetical protein
MWTLHPAAVATAAGRRATQASNIHVNRSAATAPVQLATRELLDADTANTIST